MPAGGCSWIAFCHNSSTDPVVPGAEHNFVCTSGTPLLLFTVYAPAEHAEDTKHKSKEEGDRLEDEGKVSGGVL